MAIRSDALCTVVQLQRFMSTIGMESFSSNNEVGGCDTDVVEDAINWATVEIMMYLHERYDIDDLTGTSLGAEIVNRWCVVGSARYLSLVRGNPVPDSWQIKWDLVLEKLEAVRSDNLSLPGIALRDEDIPTLSNFTIDRRYRRSKKRVTSANSTVATSGRSRDLARDYGVDLEW